MADKPRTTQCFSRHYYDVARLSRHVDLNKTQDMLFNIERHQQKYTSKGIAPLGSPKNVRLLPNNPRTTEKLAQDYNDILSEFTGATETWQDIVFALQELNRNLKTL